MQEKRHRELVRIARARYYLCLQIAKIEEQRIKLIKRLRKMRFAIVLSGTAALSLMMLYTSLN